MTAPIKAALQEMSPGPELTIAGALSALTAKFASAGIETPRLDARLLLEAAAGITQETLVLAPDRRLTAFEARRLQEFAGRRLAREPVSRILGERSFYGRPFIVTPATLDPRPETETLVEMALGLVRAAGSIDRPPRILDVGTGTGAILLTLLAEIDGATGLGTDISAAALDVARRNAEALGIAARVDWCRTRSLEGIAGPFDLIVSNPPYIASVDVLKLDPEVRDFDPGAALDGGKDGMEVVREIAAGANGCTSAAGWCVIEIGAGQAATAIGIIKECCPAGSLAGVRTATDLGGHIRCVAWQPHF